MGPSVAHRESVADVPISVFSRLSDALNAVLRALDEAVMAASMNSSTLAPSPIRRRAQGRELEEHPLQAVDAADSETEPDRIGPVAESDLLHIALNVPFNVRTAAEKDHVTDAIALRRHAFAFEDDRSFEDDDGLVEIVVPIEFALGASPDQGRSGSVRAGRQLVGAGFWITFNDP
jgi:hypothetical protein